MVAEWSEKVSSDKIIRKIFPLEGAFQYVFLLSTEENVDGVALEIQDDTGQKLEYITETSSIDNNQIIFFFTAPQDGNYLISFRTVNSRQPATCMYMAILKGEIDPLEEEGYK